MMRIIFGEIKFLGAVYQISAFIKFLEIRESATVYLAKKYDDVFYTLHILNID